MAPRAKRGEETEAEDQATGIALILPTANEVKNLAKLRKSTSTRASAITDEYAKAVQKAVEKKHVDRKALSLATSLANMDDAKLAITLPHLLHYIEALGLEERASKQGEMFTQEAGDGDDETGEEAETEGDGKKKKPRNGGRQRAAKVAGSNVTPIGEAARAVAEEAGEVSRH